MSYETTEYVAKDDDGNVTSRVNVHVVDDASDGDYVQTTGGARQVRKGDTLVQAGNPNFWDVFTGDEFGNLGYESANTGNDVPAPTGEPAAQDEPVTATGDPGGTGGVNSASGVDGNSQTGGV
jgi:hypothetical protein